MRNSTKFIAIVVALTVLVGVVAATSVHNEVTLEYEGTRLNIPRNYLLENRFPWVDSAEGLDTKQLSVVVQIPGEDIDRVLEISGVNSTPQTVVLTLISKEAVTVSLSNQRSLADQINNYQGKFSNHYAEFDSDSGYYKFHSRRKTFFSLYYLKKIPPISAKDIVASCVQSTEDLTMCRMPTFFVDNIGLETEISESQIRQVEKIQKTIIDLVENWVIKGD